MGLLWAIYIYFLNPLLTLLVFIMVAWVIASWLLSFGVIDRRNPNARAILGFLNAICGPMCRPFQRLIPPINGVLDLSPMLVLLLVVFIRDWALPQLILTVSGVPALR